jgi:hypothetical protein
MAAQLFEAGLKKNPYSRDGLFNLATVYTDTVLGKIEQIPAVLKRLNAVDPENPDNAQLGALYWQARARVLRAPAEGKDLRLVAALLREIPEREGEGIVQPLQPRRRTARAGRIHRQSFR